MKKDIFIDRIYNSNNFGQFKIIKEILDTDSKRRIFEIEFINTGYRTTASYDAIRHGSVKDKLVPIVANTGYVGTLDKKVTSPEVEFLYKPWNDMINRCYNPQDYDYHLYGAQGITVEESWFNFINFFYDAQLLPGFENKLKYPDMYQLDKDYLQLNVPKSKKVYSKNTCMWISKFDNIMIMNRENAGGYYGVVENDGYYYTRINNITYGKFLCPEAAANLFNYIYPKVRNEFNNILILNDVPPIPYEILSYFTPR